MKIQNTFKTRQAAKEYLELRGWKQTGLSVGEIVMRHPEVKETCRLIVRGKSDWRIHIYPAWPKLEALFTGVEIQS